jgi:mannose-6-phosphate isomerase-like protein (cupin superfamily)
MHNLREDDVFVVRANEWHQIANDYSVPCKIIEIQYGEETDENDIERYVYGSGDL